VLMLVDPKVGIMGFVIGGVILSILNALIKPLLIILMLPAVALTLGFFLIVINGMVVYLTSIIYSPLHIDSFWAAVLVGIVIGLVNYIVTITAEAITKRYA
jgi:putative membrane protein